MGISWEQLRDTPLRVVRADLEIMALEEKHNPKTT